MRFDMEIYGGTVSVRPTMREHADTLAPVTLGVISGIASFQTYLTHEEAVKLGNALLALSFEAEVAQSQDQVGP